MESEEHIEAVGKLLNATAMLDGIRGGKDKLQRLLGEKICHKRGKKWHYNRTALHEMGVEELETITERIIELANLNK